MNGNCFTAIQKTILVRSSQLCFIVNNQSALRTRTFMISTTCPLHNGVVCGQLKMNFVEVVEDNQSNQCQYYYRQPKQNQTLLAHAVFVLTLKEYSSSPMKIHNLPIFSCSKLSCDVQCNPHSALVYTMYKTLMVTRGRRAVI